jgi:flagella basal body P-ring formation protein FlgA
MRRLAPWLLALLLTLPAHARAQTPETVRAVVYEFLRGQSAGQPGQVSIQVGTPTLPPHLPACQQLEPWLPAGARAWGKLRVGVRCVEQASWALYVPAEVSVVGTYLVSARALRPGEILGAADVAERSGEITAMGRHLLTDPAQAIGRQMRFAVATGQPLRATMLAAPVVIESGRPVKIIVEGDGFRVANQGTALGNGRAGDRVRVRLHSGKVVSGVAGEDGVVYMRP